MILYCAKIDRAFFTNVEFSLISLLSLLCSFLTTKRHPSDVEPSYTPTFRLIQSAVYLVGVFKDCSSFVQMIDYDFKKLVRIPTKINTNICLLMPYKCIKFQPDRSMHLRVKADFVIGEVARRLITKSILWVAKSDVLEAAGCLQLCAGQQGGCEAAIHAMRDIFSDGRTEGVL